MTKSMTEGNPLKLILTFTLPLLMGNIFQQMYNLIDAAIVGKTLGSSALGSVGLSSSVQFLVLGFCIGSCVGSSIPVAQKFGAKDFKAMRSMIYHGAVVTVIFSIILTVSCAALCGTILRVLKAPDALFTDAYSYLLVIFLGIPFTMLYNFLSGILRAVGDSRTPFYFLALSAVLNIILDFFCILVLGWGCAGAAIATVVSQGISGLLCLILIIKKFEILHLTKADMGWNGKNAFSILSMGVPMGLQYSITAIGSMMMQSANNGLGTIAVSGFAAGMKIKQFAMCPFDAIASAVSTFVGQNYGAKKMDRVKKGIRQGMTLGVLYGIFIGIILMIFGRNLSMLLVDTSSTEVLDASGKYLWCLGHFYWALGILNVSRMSIQGLGFAGRAIFSGITEMFARGIVSVIFVPIWGFDAICWTDQCAWVSACFYIFPMLLYCIKKIEKDMH